MGGTLPGVLQTANFQSNPDGILSRLQEIQPDMPVMAMEFWSGWYYTRIAHEMFYKKLCSQRFIAEF